MPDNCNLEYVEHIKNYPDKPVTCAGRMDPVKAAEEIAAGRLDAVAIARQNLVDPEWVTKIKEGRQEEIKPCIRCHNGCFNMAKFKGTANIQNLEDSMHLARCALTPTTMQHKRYKIVPTKKPKKVAIIGGGIGGMECALTLKKRGHSSVIFEKSGELGGLFLTASAMSFKENDRELVRWYKREIEKAGIEIRYNTEINDPNTLRGFDEIIVATGSTPRTMPIPGFDKTMPHIASVSKAEDVSRLKSRGIDVGAVLLLLGCGAVKGVSVKTVYVLYEAGAVETGRGCPAVHVGIAHIAQRSVYDLLIYRDLGCGGGLAESHVVRADIARYAGNADLVPVAVNAGDLKRGADAVFSHVFGYLVIVDPDALFAAGQSDKILPGTVFVLIEDGTGLIQRKLGQRKINAWRQRSFNIVGKNARKQQHRQNNDKKNGAYYLEYRADRAAYGLRRDVCRAGRGDFSVFAHMGCNTSRRVDDYILNQHCIILCQILKYYL